MNGEITFKESSDVTTVYNFEGTFRFLILTGTYQSTDPTDYEQGAFALRYKKGKLIGQHALLSKNSDDLISSDYVWERV